jgi:hypothetical protein
VHSATLVRSARALRGAAFVLSSLFLLSLAPSSRGQSDVFTKWVTSPYGSLEHIVADSQSNTYVTGSINVSSDSISAVTLKVDSNGDTVWKAFLSSPQNNATGVGVSVDAAGNVYTLYASLQEQNVQYFGQEIWEVVTAKYSPTGTRQWIKFIPSTSSIYYTPGGLTPATESNGLAVTPQGDVYITYSAAASSGPDSNVIVLKYDTNGNELWSKTAPGPNVTNTPLGIQLDSNDNPYVLVNSATASHTQQGVIVKFDPSGDVLASFGPSVIGYAPIFQVDAQGDSYVAGSNPSDTADVVAKFTPTGGTAWVHSLSAAVLPIELPVGITTDPAGQVFLAQTNADAVSDNGDDIAVLSLDANGNERWLARYAHPNRSGQDSAAALTVNSAGEPTVTGYVQVSGETQVATVKFLSTGTLAWAQLYPSTPGGDSGEAITGAGPNVFVLATISNPSTGAGGTVIIDYVQDAAKVSPSGLTFGSQAEKTQSAPQSFTLTNTAEVAMTQISFSITGDFQLINNCPTSLAAGASCTVGVTFTPTATGTRTGTVTVHDDWGGSTTNPQTVTLTGTGTN